MQDKQADLINTHEQLLAAVLAKVLDHLQAAVATGNVETSVSILENGL
jgi:hypothetical protein